MKKLIILSVIAFFTTVSFAQVNTGSGKQGKTDASKMVTYTCPMHPEVLLSKPGKCPKCGMTLVQKKVMAAKTYTCPMHADVVSDKPGKCPKCGMTLVEKKAVSKRKTESMEGMKMK